MVVLRFHKTNIMPETATHQPKPAALERAERKAARKRAERERTTKVAAHVLHGLLVKRTYGETVYNKIKATSETLQFDALEGVRASIDKARGTFVHPKTEVAPEKLEPLANAFHDEGLPASEDFRNMIQGLFGPTTGRSLDDAVRHDVTKKLWDISGGHRATGEEIRTTGPANQAEVRLLHAMLKVNDGEIPGAMEALAQAYTAPQSERGQAEARADTILDAAYGVPGVRNRVEERVGGLMQDVRNDAEASLGELYVSVLDTVRLELKDSQSAIYQPLASAAQ